MEDLVIVNVLQLLVQACAVFVQLAPFIFVLFVLTSGVCYLLQASHLIFCDILRSVNN